MNAIFTRRSIRKFTDKPVEPEKVERLLRAAMQAPSAMNRQAWEFLVITDEEDRLAVSKMNPYAKMVPQAQVLIVTMMNFNLTDHNEIWTAEDMSAATQNILLQAVEEGLGAVWLGWFPDEYRVTSLQKHFALPENVVPFSIVALGYSDVENHFEDRFRPERVHYGKY